MYVIESLCFRNLLCWVRNNTDNKIGVLFPDIINMIFRNIILTVKAVSSIRT